MWSQHLHGEWNYPVLFSHIFFFTKLFHIYIYTHTREKQCLNQFQSRCTVRSKKKKCCLSQNKESWVNRDRYGRSVTEDSNPATLPLMKFRLETMVLGLGPEVQWLLVQVRKEPFWNLGHSLCRRPPRVCFYIDLRCFAAETCSDPFLCFCCSVAKSCLTLLEPHEL